MPGDPTNRWELAGGKDIDADLPSSLADFRHEPDTADDHYDATEEHKHWLPPNCTRDQLLGGRWPNIGSGDI